jgi:Tfp pilus assembly protein PilF
MRPLTHRLSAVVVLLAGLLLGLSGCNSSSAWTRNQLGKRSYDGGDYTAARRSFEQALMNDPWNPNYAFNVAAAMQRQGDHIAAERMYQHALTLNPSHQPSYHALAGMLHQNGRTDEAQELLSAWVDTQPYMAESHVEMAWMQQEMGDYAAAEASLQQALQRNPRHARAMAQLGQVYQQTGRQANAAALYNRSLAYNRMQPQVAAQLNGMGYSPQFSPGLMMAQQMPQYDPTLTAFPQFAQPQMAQTPVYGAASPYTSYMPNTMGGPMANSSQPVPQMGMMNGATMDTAGLEAAGWQLVSTNTVPGPGSTAGLTATTAGMTVDPSAGQFVSAPAMTQFIPPTTAGALPTTQSTGFIAPTMGTPVPAYSTQPVQLGTPVPISQYPAAAIPAISAVVPVVSPF